jgi:hypothetical protein
MNKSTIKVKTGKANGILKFKSKSKPKSNVGAITSLVTKNFK